jgi:hypothetical protein
VTTPVFCSSTGSNTSPYETWAKAATTFATAIAQASTSGDVVVVDATNPPAAVVSSTTWTFAANCSVIASTNSGTATITPTTMGATTWIGSTNDQSITLAGAFRVYLYGITIRSGSAAGNGININTTDGGHFELESCYIWCSQTGTASSAFNSATAGNNNFTQLKNCTLRYGATGQTVQFRGAFEMLGGSVSSAGSALTTFCTAGSNSSSIKFIGVDLSHITGTLVGNNANSAVIYEFVQCRFSTSLSAVMATQTSVTNKGSAKVFVYACNAGTADAHGLFAYYDAFGTLTSDTGIYFTGGAASQSWKIVTTANCSFGTPFVSPWVSLYNTGTSAITPRLEVLRDGSATAYKDSEVWGQFSVKDNAGFTNPTFYNDRQALVDWAAGTAGASQASGSDTWDGENATHWAGKVDSGAAVTPDEAGHIRGRVVVGAPSITVYADPQIRT